MIYKYMCSMQTIKNSIFINLSIHREMMDKDVVHIYNGRLLSHKK